MQAMKQILLPLLVVLTLSACGDATKIRPATFAEMDGWKADTLTTPLRMFRESCIANQKRARGWQSINEGPVGVRENWNYACAKADTVPEGDEAAARKFFETTFAPYKVETESSATGLVTGYYEPIINGSTVKKAPYLTPVYGIPKDFGERKPYHSRAEIVAGALNGKAPVLYYVDDPVLLFFLHVQGSGKVRLPDGHMEGIQYAGQNGYAYTPIGRILKDRGELSAVSMQSIRDWLKAHPAEMDEVMNQNESYVFFKKGPGDKPAKGALGIPLTPSRSIAVDDDRAAYGVPTFLDTMQSEYKTGRQVPFRRLMISQDTGGALKGPHRADLFYGQGVVEEWQAGHQNARAKTYWLLPLAEPPVLTAPTPAAIESATPDAAAMPELAPETPLIVVPSEPQPDAPAITTPDE